MICQGNFYGSTHLKASPFEKIRQKPHLYLAQPVLSCYNRESNIVLGNTAQSLCVRCVVRFFGRLPRNSAGILPYGKGFLGNMTENLHADCVQSHQAGFVRCCRKAIVCKIGRFIHQWQISCLSRQYRTKIVRQMRRQIFFAKPLDKRERIWYT